MIDPLGDLEFEELVVVVIDTFGDLEFEALVVVVIDTFGDLELLGEIVVVLVTDGLTVSDTVTDELIEEEPVLLSDMCADSDADTVGDSRLEIDGDPVTLYDSEFEYELNPEADISAVLERAPVLVKLLVIV